MFSGTDYSKDKQPKLRTYASALDRKQKHQPPFDNETYRFVPIYNAASLEFNKTIMRGQLFYHPSSEEFGILRKRGKKGDAEVIIADFPSGRKELVVNYTQLADNPVWEIPILGKTTNGAPAQPPHRKIPSDPQSIQRYWEQPENLKENLDWLIAQVRIPFEELPRRISARLLIFNFGDLFNKYKTVFNIINTAYPGVFHIWEFRHNGKNFWKNSDGTNNYELCRKATQWLVEEKLGLNAINSGTVIAADFKRYGLESMLKSVYGGSPLKTVDDAYPGVTGKKHHRHAPNFWTSSQGLETAIDAIHKLVENKGYSTSEITTKLTYKEIVDAKLSHMLNAVESHSHFDLIIAAYPQFNHSDFSRYKDLQSDKK
jgi:hypothetical protein